MAVSEEIVRLVSELTPRNDGYTQAAVARELEEIEEYIRIALYRYKYGNVKENQDGSSSTEASTKVEH